MADGAGLPGLTAGGGGGAAVPERLQRRRQKTQAGFSSSEEHLRGLCVLFVFLLMFVPREAK